MAIPKKYDRINFYPTQEMADTAARGLRWREKAGGRGGLTTQEASKEGVGSGVQRAVQIKYRRQLSPDTVRRMVAFFDRHEKNKAVEPGKEPHEDRGAVAWALWGGDAGRRWANKVLRQMQAADAKA
jgi:hypothetical protein